MWLCFFPIEVEAFAALGDAEFVAVDAEDQRRVARPGEVRSADAAVGSSVATGRLHGGTSINDVH